MKNNVWLLLGLGALFSISNAVQAKTDFPEGQKCWSVRMAESEMVRNPESWMLDFQPALKWDYCHGLELGAMLDVYTNCHLMHSYMFRYYRLFHLLHQYNLRFLYLLFLIQMLH